MRTRPPTRARRGHSLVEISVAGVMAALLVMIVGESWAAFVRPAAHAIAIMRVSQEAGTIAHALAGDLGSSLRGPDGRDGRLDQYRFLEWRTSVDAEGSLYFQAFYSRNGKSIDGNSWENPTADDAIISYGMVGNRLVRVDSRVGVPVTLARLVDGFSLAFESEAKEQATITVSFRLDHREKVAGGMSEEFVRVYRFVAYRP